MGDFCTPFPQLLVLCYNSPEWLSKSNMTEACSHETKDSEFSGNSVAFSYLHRYLVYFTVICADGPRCEWENPPAVPASHGVRAQPRGPA